MLNLLNLFSNFLFQLLLIFICTILGGIVIPNTIYLIQNFRKGKYSSKSKHKWILKYSFLILQLILQCYIPYIVNASSVYSETEKITYLTKSESLIEYYIHICSKQYVDMEELGTLSDEELYYIRYGLYAIQGRYFHSSVLSTYFSQYEWYEPYIAAYEFDYDMLNSYQQTNLSRIVAIELSRGIYE